MLWDMDGTLVDTAPIHWPAWNKVLAPEGRQLTWEEFLPTFGFRNDTLIPMWVGPQVQADDIQRIAKAKEEGFRELLETVPIPLLPGAQECLHMLRALGWNQAIASMAPRQNVEVILKKLDIDRYLDAVVTGDEVLHGKPDPAIFLKAAARLGVMPADCVVIEDSSAGVEAARRAGMHVIGVGTAIDPGSADLNVLSLTELNEDTFLNIV